MTLTPVNLFNIIIKIFGLIFLREVVNELLTTVSTFMRYVSMSEYDYGPSMWTLLISVAVLALYAVLCFQLLFKTNKIISLLKLDKGFEEYELSLEESKSQTLSLSTPEILTICLTVIGGYMLISEIPAFLRLLYSYFDGRKSDYYAMPPEIFSHIVTSAAKIIIALLLLGERQKIITFIENRQRAEEQIDL